MKLCKKDVSDLATRKYVTYARHTIIERALADFRDGLKPVQRRIMFSMHQNNQYIDAVGKNGKTHKSARVVGDVMGRFHPHGDSSIYGAIISMTDDYNDLLFPYINGNGSFGSVWSEESAGSMRYTEIALNKIARELFDGISEDSVQMLPNYDDSEVEPEVLPTKFPSILVNSTMGIAVSYASNIPRFDLSNVCKATTAVIKGELTEPDGLLDILGYPDFTTAGNIHANPQALRSLYADGQGKLTISGTVTRRGNVIEVTEVPYSTTVERIIEQIKKAIDDGKIKDINDVKNSNGFNDKLKNACPGIYIELKRGADDKKVLAQLVRYTDLRSSVSFNMTVLLNGKPERIGVYELLKNWIEWRQSVIQRQYSYKLGKEKDKLHLLESWEKLNVDIKEVVQLLTGNSESKAKELLKEKFGLDDLQVDYLYERKIRTLTSDKLQNELEKLTECRNNVKEYTDVVDNLESRLKLIVAQLEELSTKYPTVRYSKIVDTVNTDEEDEILNEKVEDREVYFVINSKGQIKRAMDLDTVNYLTDKYSQDSPIVETIKSNNLESLLVFTNTGYCFKYPVHRIDNNSRSKFNESIRNLCKIPDNDKIVHIDASGDYSKAIIVLYETGKAEYLSYAYLSGNRSKYKSLYTEFGGELKGTIISDFKPMFLISNKKKARFFELGMILANNKARFRMAQTAKGEKILGYIYQKDALPVDAEEYNRPYCIKIREPIAEDTSKFVYLR